MRACVEAPASGRGGSGDVAAALPGSQAGAGASGRGNDDSALSPSSQSGAGGSASGLSRSGILQHLDIVTVSLGLLINLTSATPPNRALLRQVVLPSARVADACVGAACVGSGCVGSVDIAPAALCPSPPASQPRRRARTPATCDAAPSPSPAPAPAPVPCMVRLLCGIFNTLEQRDEGAAGGGGGALASPGSVQADAAGVAAGAGGPLKGNDEDALDVTVDDLTAGHQAGEAAIVGAYAAMLLGFLVGTSMHAA